MSPGPLLLLLGLTGQALFGLRMLLQWVASEKAGRSVVPRWFWHISLAGSACVISYAALVGNLVFLLTALPGAFVYARNLTLRGPTQLVHLVHLVPLAAVLGTLVVWAALQKPLAGPPVLAGVGFAGWLLWMSRFLVPWWISERRGTASLGATFWMVSLVGALLLLVYAAWLRDPVMILAFAVGPVAYVRNLLLIRRSRGKPGACPGAGARGV